MPGMNCSLNANISVAKAMLVNGTCFDDIKAHFAVFHFFKVVMVMMVMVVIMVVIVVVTVLMMMMMMMVIMAMVIIASQVAFYKVAMVIINMVMMRLRISIGYCNGSGGGGKFCGWSQEKKLFSQNYFPWPGCRHTGGTPG